MVLGVQDLCGKFFVYTSSGHWNIVNRLQHECRVEFRGRNAGGLERLVVKALECCGYGCCRNFEV